MRLCITLALLVMLRCAAPGIAWAGDTLPSASVLEVVVSGIGATHDSAMKDAWRAAVLQATGGLMSAETLSRNNVLVRDEVLVYAAGFVENYTEIDQRIVDGLVVVDARVSVRKTELRQRLEKLQLVVKVDGASLAATASTKLQQAVDGRELLTKALGVFREDVTRIELIGTPVVSVANGKSFVRYHARVG